MPQTWVTRTGVKIDRIASAWLIGRFISPDALFKFIDAADPERIVGEIRFDMFEGLCEFTHRDDLCTFEVLLEHAALNDAALRRIGDSVHDLDLKDNKFGHPETSGIASLIAGIARATKTMRSASNGAARPLTLFTLRFDVTDLDDKLQNAGDDHA